MDYCGLYVKYIQTDETRDSLQLIAHDGGKNGVKHKNQKGSRQHAAIAMVASTMHRMIVQRFPSLNRQHAWLRFNAQTSRKPQSCANTGREPHLFFFSSSSRGGNEVSDEEGEDAVVISNDRPRNKILEAVARDGMGYLSQTASVIQASKHAQKSLSFDPAKVSKHSSERQKAEQHRVLSTASSCLERLSRNDPGLCLGGEPAMFIGCHVTANLRDATIYWALPYSILLSETLTNEDKALLQSKMQQIMDRKCSLQVQRGVNAALSFYYPPKLKFEPATGDMMQAFFEDVLEDW